MTEKRVKHKIVQEVKILARQMATPDPSSEEEPVDDKLDYFSSLYANEDEERASSSKRSNDHILEAERFFVDPPIKSTRPVSPHLLPNPLLRKLFVKINSAIPSSLSSTA